MHRNKTLIAALAITAIVSTLARADEPAGSEKQLEPITHKFTLHAAQPPYAVMKYRLLPRYIDQTPGNAAPQYMRAALKWESEKRYQDSREKIWKWMEMPLDELKNNSEATSFYDNTPTGDWNLIRLAARREYCEWDIPLRENNTSTLIPEIVKLRDLGRLIAFKARIEMARGQFDQAIDSLQTGFALARHAAEGHTVVNGSLGNHVARLMLEEVDDLVQLPDCPNLYWTLAALPNPLVDLGPALEREQDSVYLMFPELRNVRTANRSAAEWEAMLNSFVKSCLKLSPDVVGADVWNKLNRWAMEEHFFSLAYPQARTELEAAGYSKAKIDAMPPAQAILTAIAETSDHERDQLFQWLLIPMPESYARLRQAEKNPVALKNQPGGEIVAAVTAILPALVHVKGNEVRLQREVAAVRVIEAIRWYAAEHDGQLPQQLSEITQVPLPVDAVTGKPFEYELHDGKAVLSSPPLPGERAPQGSRWELEMAAAK